MALNLNLNSNSNFNSESQFFNFTQQQINKIQNIKMSHSHQRLSKYHYHLKQDKIYGDKKLKLCGQCIAPSNLSNDLKQLGKLTKRDEENEADKISLLNSFRPIDYSQDSKIDFEVLDLTAERQSGLNLPIIYLPDDLFRFKQLKRLHLDCNQIKALPDKLGENLINLEILTISSNQLQKLPNSLANLKKLVSLHLSNNDFKKFPDILCDIESLKFLDLCTNYIENIPSKIGNLKNLTSLLLFQNNIKTIPDSIGKLKNLRTLWIGNNRVQVLPRQILELNKLEWNFNEYLNLSTNLDGNPIKEPPYQVCSKGLVAIKEYYEKKSLVSQD